MSGAEPKVSGGMCQLGVGGGWMSFCKNFWQRQILCCFFQNLKKSQGSADRGSYTPILNWLPDVATQSNLIGHSLL